LNSTESLHAPVAQGAACVGFSDPYSLSLTSNKDVATAQSKFFVVKTVLFTDRACQKTHSGVDRNA
jgi:hypothetical protein